MTPKQEDKKTLFEIVEENQFGPAECVDALKLSLVAHLQGADNVTDPDIENIMDALNMIREVIAKIK